MVTVILHFFDGLVFTRGEADRSSRDEFFFLSSSKKMKKVFKTAIAKNRFYNSLMLATTLLGPNQGI